MLIISYLSLISLRKTFHQLRKPQQIQETVVLFTVWPCAFCYWCVIHVVRYSQGNTGIGVRESPTVMSRICCAPIWLLIIVQLLGYKNCIRQGLGECETKLTGLTDTFFRHPNDI